MEKGIPTDWVCALAGISPNTLASWLARGQLGLSSGRPGVPREWVVADVFRVTLFSRLLADSRSVARAGREAESMTTAVGDLIHQILSADPPPVECVVFLSAVTPDGECVDRVVFTRQDLERLTLIMVKAKPISLSLLDCTDIFERTLLAFRQVRTASPAKPREKAYA